MARKTSGRLNDTAALAAIPTQGLDSHESRSSSVRRIDNGYIASQSSYKDGRHEYKETYSESPPNMEIDQQPNPLTRAVNYMKSDGTL